MVFSQGKTSDHRHCRSLMHIAVLGTIQSLLYFYHAGRAELNDGEYGTWGSDHYEGRPKGKSGGADGNPKAKLSPNPKAEFRSPKEIQ
jgi:hypothetical protein